MPLRHMPGKKSRYAHRVKHAQTESDAVNIENNVFVHAKDAKCEPA